MNTVGVRIGDKQKQVHLNVSTSTSTLVPKDHKDHERNVNEECLSSSAYGHEHGRTCLTMYVFGMQSAIDVISALHGASSVTNSSCTIQHPAIQLHVVKSRKRGHSMRIAGV